MILKYDELIHMRVSGTDEAQIGEVAKCSKMHEFGL